MSQQEPSLLTLVGLSVADGSMGYDELLQWVLDHRK